VIYGVAAKLGLRCGRRLARSSERIHLTDKLVLCFGKVKIRLFQPQIPLPTLFIVGLLRQSGALCGLPSEEFGIRHSRASDSSLGALQHFLYCNAIAFISSYIMAVLISKAASQSSPLPDNHQARVTSAFGH
jgi:hypothetical protein